jgi:hypothetical protein
MRRRAIIFDISPVGSAEKRAGTLRLAALRRGKFEQKHVLSKVPGGNRRSVLFEGMGRNSHHRAKASETAKAGFGPTEDATLRDSTTE